MGKQSRKKQTAAPRVPTSEKLAKALEEAGAPAEMIARARDGYYDDYRGHSAFNIVELVSDARALGLDRIAARANDGEFDAQKWESDEWARSPEGQEAFRDLLKGGPRHD